MGSFYQVLLSDLAVIEGRPLKVRSRKKTPPRAKRITDFRLTTILFERQIRCFYILRTRSFNDVGWIDDGHANTL